MADVCEILESMRPGFRPRNALYFGCGVGRLLIPLAARVQEVSGVDISERMLEITRENLKARGYSPVWLGTTLDRLPADARYDLVHSFIVLQHIPVGQAVPIFGELLRRVSQDGIAVLHLTYSPASHPMNRWATHARAKFKGFVLRNGLLSSLVKLIKGRLPDPPMLMENFPLNEIFALLHDEGFNDVRVRPSFHGMRGIVIFAQRLPERDFRF
ncbi:MAG TPA: methyltransferase domain-containing protein [Chthoniobacterales bacterium]|nr:methyltransferase domain-containing protein [Chthoniobacterales bacterium]